MWISIDARPEWHVLDVMPRIEEEPRSGGDVLHPHQPIQGSPCLGLPWLGDNTPPVALRILWRHRGFDLNIDRQVVAGENDSDIRERGTSARRRQAEPPGDPVGAPGGQRSGRVFDLHGVRGKVQADAASVEPSTFG